MALVETDLVDGVLTVTLADVAHRNTLSRQLSTELVTALDQADGDPSIRVVVLTNSGTVFCAGADLSEQAAHDHEQSSSSSRLDPLAIFGRFRSSPKPYVGRIAGHCVAGGMGLAAALDISVASRDAKFGFSEVRVGVAPAMISVICLPKMRLGDARSTFLRGGRFTADEAVRLGLITTAVDPEDLDDEVDAVVADLLEGAPGAIAATKELLATVPSMAADQAFAWTKELSARLFSSEEARQGMTAFLEKRPPPWSPRAH